MQKDIQLIDKNIEELEKVIKRTNNKDTIGERDLLLKVKEMYKENKNVRDNPDWNYKEIWFSCF